MLPFPGPRVKLCCTRWPVKTRSEPSSIFTGKRKARPSGMPQEALSSHCLIEDVLGKPQLLHCIWYRAPLSRRSTTAVSCSSFILCNLTLFQELVPIVVHLGL